MSIRTEKTTHLMCPITTAIQWLFTSLLWVLVLNFRSHGSVMQKVKSMMDVCMWLSFVKLLFDTVLYILILHSVKMCYICLYFVFRYNGLPQSAWCPVSKNNTASAKAYTLCKAHSWAGFRHSRLWVEKFSVLWDKYRFRHKVLCSV